jgi:hypothetical protein
LRGKGKEKSNLDRKGKTLKREKEGRDKLERKGNKEREK